MQQRPFTRRGLLKNLGSLGLVATLRPVCRSLAAEDLDRFGGLKSVRFEASGYFRVARNDRWWFVTPDGSAFLSFGLNHPNKDYVRQDYNIEHWKREFGVGDAYSPEFLAAFAAKTMKDIRYFGMNTLGCHALKEDFGRITIPYIQGLFFVRTAYWLVQGPRSFPDVFSQAFQQHCERIAQRVAAPKREDPYLMGYTFTNVPILTDRDADAHGEVPWGRSQPNMPTWPRVLRNHPGSSPGKKVYVDLMRERYTGIAEFNRTYQSSFASFEDLQNTANWCPFIKAGDIDDAADDHEFLKKILDQYYSVGCAAVRKVDPNHMIFGDPLNANTAPPDDIVALMARHCDLIAYQCYGNYDLQRPLLDRWSAVTKKPLFHADSSFSVADEHMPDPIGVVCADHETRAREFLDCATQLLARPDIVGWNWCGWMDMWSDWKSDRQHTGLQNPFGKYHHPMPETMARFGAKLYNIGLNSTNGSQRETQR